LYAHAQVVAVPELVPSPAVDAADAELVPTTLKAVASVVTLNRAAATARNFMLYHSLDTPDYAFGSMKGNHQPPRRRISPFPEFAN
jgi:hypothetical protein